MKFILGTVFLLGQVLLCLSQSGGGEANADASVELPCGLNQKILDKAKGALNISTINLPILRCLCQLKIKSSASAGGSVSAGGADASASVDVGIDVSFSLTNKKIKNSIFFLNLKVVNFFFFSSFKITAEYSWL